ncbi:MAG: aldehyde dehydrogenase [Candidatus Marinimicrobia bacterium]|nr:aldehyde dehydrogenase [Candidatus Neomarinimicrobiota bacterium]
MELIANYINGKFILPISKSYLDVYEPATGQVYAQVPDSNQKDIEIAVKAATNAFHEWSESKIEYRSGILHSIADELEKRLDELAEYESRDTGKPISLARSVDIPRAIANFRFFAGYINNFENESELNSDISSNFIYRSPLGVVGCISPWNLPLYLFSWKIAPALAVGNTVLGKPSEITPYTAFKLGEVCAAAGVPNGVLNIVHGSGQQTGDAIVRHPGVKAISFTGGTNTGEIIAKTAAPMLKKISLELGGKNPAIVYADCDYKKTLAAVVKSSFTNQGQICLSSSRILIEKPIYDRFKTDFVKKVSELKPEDPANDSSSFGALVSKEQFEKIEFFINLIQEEGGEILTGGNSGNLNGRCENGWFFEPTVVSGLDNKSRVNQEEIFGPVVTLISFDGEDDGVSIANDTVYGLSATIWTEDIEKANRTARSLDSGVIWINCWLVRDLRTPFGGMKQSGVGREGGMEVLNFFTEQKNICMSYR